MKYAGKRISWSFLSFSAGEVYVGERMDDIYPV